MHTKFLITFYLMLSTSTLCLRADSLDLTWLKTVWQNEPAWISHRGDVTAVVSEARGRLVYFGGDPQGLQQNLIFVSALRREITGSHAVWLGPQSLWGWPAPKDWDSPPSKVEIQGETLRLTEPHTDVAYPQLTRVYKWKSADQTMPHDGLELSVSWADTATPYFVMQIIQVPAAAHCSLKLIKSVTLPIGAVLVEQNVRANPHFTMPDHGVQLSSDQQDITVVPKEPAIKMGVMPQSILAQQGNWSLVIERGEFDGTVHGEGPDFGCFTQVWTGSPELGYFEAEQFSPLLTPANNLPAKFSITLQAFQLKQ